MGLSGISHHGGNNLTFHSGSAVKSLWVCTLTSQYPSWYDFRCCKDITLEQLTIFNSLKRNKLQQTSDHIQFPYFQMESPPYCCQNRNLILAFNWHSNCTRPSCPHIVSAPELDNLLLTSHNAITMSPGHTLSCLLSASGLAACLFCCCFTP